MATFESPLSYCTVDDANTARNTTSLIIRQPAADTNNSTALPGTNPNDDSDCGYNHQRPKQQQQQQSLAMVSYPSGDSLVTFSTQEERLVGGATPAPATIGSTTAVAVGDPPRTSSSASSKHDDKNHIKNDTSSNNNAADGSTTVVTINKESANDAAAAAAFANAAVTTSGCEWGSSDAATTFAVHKSGSTHHYGGNNTNPSDRRRRRRSHSGVGAMPSFLGVHQPQPRFVGSSDVCATQIAAWLLYVRNELQQNNSASLSNGTAIANGDNGSPAAHPPSAVVIVSSSCLAAIRTAFTY